jgi:predicted ATPase
MPGAKGKFLPRVGLGYNVVGSLGPVRPVMITLVEARSYRCLHYVSTPLRQFQILVGPNGSGKSAFMDVLGFIRDFVSFTIQYAVKERTDNFHDLVYGREDSSFDLAIEAQIPENRRVVNQSGSYTHVRYDLSVRLDAASDVSVVETERMALLDPTRKEPRRIAERNRTDYELTKEDDVGSRIRGNLSPFHSVVSFFPAGANNFPILMWFATLLREGIRDVRLRAEDLHRPSTVAAEKASRLTGANLARSVFELRERSRDSFEAWIKHVRTALPDFDTVRTELRQQERSRHLILRYQNGIEVPSRVVSDGTLSLLALTILAYMPDSGQVYLIEEPENAVHPTAVDTIYQSLSSVYESQVLMASHSPILLGLAKKEELLCFSRTEEGTRIVPGDQHRVLQEWKGEVNLSDLFAAGVLD